MLNANDQEITKSLYSNITSVELYNKALWDSFTLEACQNGLCYIILPPDNFPNFNFLKPVLKYIGPNRAMQYNNDVYWIQTWDHSGPHQTMVFFIKYNGPSMWHHIVKSHEDAYWPDNLSLFSISCEH